MLPSICTRNSYRILTFLVVFIFSNLFIISCKEEEGDDPIPAPVINSIDPTSGPVGIEVTINGSNFSETPSENIVSFNDEKATVISAAVSRLVVEVPASASTGNVSVTVNGQKASGPVFTVEEETGIEFDCTQNEITSSTTWEDVESGDKVDYIIKCAISVKNNALLTIEPGVIIQFEGEESGIFTSDGGGLKAIGTEDNPIKFVGTSETAGIWKGVYFASTNPENRLEFVEIKHAGRTASSQSGVKGAVQLSSKANSKGSIVDCTIGDNDGYGIFITENSDLVDFENNMIQNNTLSPVGIDFNQIRKLDDGTDYGNGNGQAYIEVFNSILEEDATVLDVGLPYRFTENQKYYIEKGLVIEPGVTFEFASGAGLRLGENAVDCSLATGTINATGTAEKPIIFKGVSGGKGSWLGIGINSSSPENKLIYCEISGGGAAKIFNASKLNANITLQCESKVKIQNTTISQSGGYGIYMLDEDAVLDEFQNNTLKDNEEAPVYIHFNQLDQLDETSSYAEENGKAFIEVEGEDLIDNDLSISALDVPYRINVSNSGREVYVEKAITIEAGTILEFETGAGIVLGSPGVDCIPTTGSIKAIGTAENPIIFRGANEGVGTWLGLGFNSSTSLNELMHCQISGGGSKQMYNAGGQGNLVIHCKGNLKITNSTIKDSGGWGVDFVQGGNSLSESDNTFENNSSGDIATQ